MSPATDEINSPSFSRLGVVPCGTPVESNAGLAANDPRIVTGRDDERITGPKVALGSIVHRNVHPAGDDVSGVGRLAGLGASDRLDVVGPPPARLENSSAHDGSGNRHHPEFTVGELSDFIWFV
jgi:hypothetical protein